MTFQDCKGFSDRRALEQHTTSWAGLMLGDNLYIYDILQFYYLCFKGPLPDPKKPRPMHGTLIMKENVSNFNQI